jgi:hypothetical protein
MKKQADQQRSKRSFEVGDLVFLKLQPYVQTSLAPRAHQKLALKFFGPYRILSRVGSVAYKLELPAHSFIHPVFHVSQLKKAVGAGHQVTPVLSHDFAIKLAPEQVLDTRVVARGSNQVKQVFIKWNNLPITLATWEDYDAIREEFPRATAWGQAVLQGGGC